MNVHFHVEPEESPTTRLDDRIIEVRWYKSVPDDDGTAELVHQSLRFSPGPGLIADADLRDVDSSSATVSILSSEGIALISREIPVANERSVMIVSAEELTIIEEGGQRLPPPSAGPKITRTGRLIHTGSIRMDLKRARLLVAPIPAGADRTRWPRPLQTAPGQSTALEMTGQDLSWLNSYGWISISVAIDGQFVFDIVPTATDGWVWWLTGDNTIVGFMPDDLTIDVRGAIAIILPALQKRVLTTSQAQVGSAQLPARLSDCDCEGESVPRNVSESELIDNPEVFSEDPGAFCRPFSNPERVLSERAFQVIARISQPDIGARSSLKTKTQQILDLSDNAAVAPSAPTNVLGRIASVFRGSAPSSMLSVAPLFSLPKRLSMPQEYKLSVGTMPSGRTTMNADHPLQWEDDVAQYQANSVAYGHLLEFRVRWRSNGYSLGTVAKTLTLAPRQARRIQKIEWERTETARRRERTQLADEVNDAVSHELDYHDSVAANLSEWSSGSSSSSMAGVAGGIGFFAPPVIGGIGGGASTAGSSSRQNGGRESAASEEQRLRDAIRRHGDSLRRFESTVVNEVSQEENVVGTTEVIRNPNYAHSLTVIYYQILRHLRVNTGFAGVRECLFIPFSIKPFDIHRTHRWREAITAHIRSTRFSRALRYLRDVATNFTTSEIPIGSRAQQRLTFVRGSIFLSLGIERPRDAADGTFLPDSWNRLQPFLGLPAFGIFSGLSSIAVGMRDRIFQAEQSGRIAAEWTNGLTLKLGTRTVAADFTLASRYQYNQVVRVDFTIPATELLAITREAMTDVTLGHTTGLPPGSIANLRRATITYTTDRFERTVEGRTGTNDLVNPTSGDPDNATFGLPLDAWERVDERLEIRRSVQELLEHLNEHAEFYHKAIWWRMDRDRLMMMLDGFFVPGSNGVSIASVVDREPVGIIGNSLVYRVGAASFIGYGQIDTPAKLFDVYSDRDSTTAPLYISLPTDGLYAQTIMDECAALEEHYGNTDWVLNDKDPDLGTIDASLLTSRRSDPGSAVAPTSLPGTIINLLNAPDAPAPSGLQGVLNAVSNPGAFRDMAGLAGTQANAQAALTTAANLATNFANQAAALELAKLAKADQATKTADQKLAAIENAKSKGLTTDAAAVAHANEALSAMNPDAPRAVSPHQDPVINKAIERMPAVPGSRLSATNAEGTVSLAIGADPGTVTTAATGGTSSVVPGSTGAGGTGGSTPIASTNTPVDILLNGVTNDTASYVAWAPRPCAIRSIDGSAQRVLVRNETQTGGGQIVFLAAIDGATQDELIVDVPRNGQVDFFVCGRFDRLAGVGFPSTNDKDTAIVVSTLDATRELGRRALMVRVRKDANTLTPGERDRFLSAIMQLNQPGGAYVDFQNRHVRLSSDEIHGRACFLPWHRGFVLDLERRLQSIDPSVALPYWRFDRAAPNLFTRAFMGAPDPGDVSGVVEFDASNPLVNWRMQVLGSGSGRFNRIPDFDPLVSPANVIDENATFTLGSDFGDPSDVTVFSAMERDPHGSAHVSFSGTISDIGLAPGDPLFFLLHANVDRLWAKWQWLSLGQRFDGRVAAAYPRQGNGDPLVGFDEGIGNYTDDTMWPWNGSFGAPRPPDAPGGTFTPTSIAVEPGPQPTVISMIDYQGQLSLANDLGFAYDDVPYDLAISI